MRWIIARNRRPERRNNTPISRSADIPVNYTTRVRKIIAVTAHRSAVFTKRRIVNKETSSDALFYPAILPVVHRRTYARVLFKNDLVLKPYPVFSRFIGALYRIELRTKFPRRPVVVVCRKAIKGRSYRRFVNYVAPLIGSFACFRRNSDNGIHTHTHIYKRR